MKKDGSGTLPTLDFAENPDILATVSRMGDGRPALVVGFAAETHDVIAHATAKRDRKGCDWIVANDVSPETGIMGGSENAVTLISDAGSEDWPRMGKVEVARKLAARIAEGAGMSGPVIRVLREDWADRNVALPPMRRPGLQGRIFAPTSCPRIGKRASRSNRWSGGSCPRVCAWRSLTGSRCRSGRGPVWR